MSSKRARIVESEIAKIQKEIAGGDFGNAPRLPDLANELKDLQSSSIVSQIAEIQAEIADGNFDRAPLLPDLQQQLQTTIVGPLSPSSSSTTTNKDLSEKEARLRKAEARVQALRDKEKKKRLEQEVSTRRKIVEEKLKKGGIVDDGEELTVENHPSGLKEGRLNTYTATDILRALGGDDVEECQKWLADPASHIEDTENVKQQTALIWCCRRGSTKCLSLLVAAGANINATMMAGGTGVYVSTQEDQVDCLKILLDAKADPDSRLEASGVKAINIGAMMGRIECLKKLIAAGADVNSVANDGTSVLYSARQSENEQCIQLLIDAGAEETEEMVSAGEKAYTIALDEAVADMKEEAAERITRFIRYAGQVNTMGGGSGARLAARAFSGKTKKREKAAKARKANRRKSFIKMTKETRQSMTESEVTLEGYLTKQSRGFKKSWQTRYFELAGHYLKYYTSGAKGEVRAVANMEDLEKIEADADALRQQSEFILVIDGVEMRLRASNEKEKRKWVEALAPFVAENQKAAEEKEKEAGENGEDKNSEGAGEGKGEGGEQEQEQEEQEDQEEEKKGEPSGSEDEGSEKKAGESKKKTKKQKKQNKKKKRKSFSTKKSSFRKSVYDDDVVINGYLSKQAGSKWQIRYFEIAGHYLKFYADAGQKEVKAAINLDTLTDVKKTDTSMMLTFDDVSELELKAANPADAQKWFEILETTVIENKKKPPKGTVDEEKAKKQKQALLAFYDVHAPDKKAALTEEVFEYFLDRRDELNEGLFQKYGTDLDGKQALWFPTDDEDEREQRRIIAANRIRRWTRSKIATNPWGLDIKPPDEEDKATAEKPKKSPKKRRRRSSVQTKKFRGSVYGQETVMEGYLDKRTEGMFKSWVNKYFTLSGHYLKFFKAATATDKELKGVVDLLGLTSLTQPEAMPTQLDLEVEEHTIQLRAPSIKEAKKWVEALTPFLEVNEKKAKESEIEDKTV